MKTVKKSFATILATIMLLTIGFTSLSISDRPLKASARDYINYYFYDLYPSLDTEYQNMDFDYNPVDYNGFIRLVEDYTYFANLHQYNAIIIDLKKSFLPCGILHQFFKYLKDRYGCTLVFVSAYSEEDYRTDTGFERYNFFEYLDKFYCSDFSRLADFFRNGFKTLAGMHDSALTDDAELNLQNICFIIDGQSAKTEDEDDEYYGIPDGNPSLFMKYFLQQLNADTVDQGLYSYMFQEFEEKYNIRILIHIGGNKFFEPYRYGYGSETFIADDVYELQNQIGFDYLCATGLWEFDTDFYNFLCVATGESYLFKTAVFAISGELIQYGEGGLPLMSAEDLENLYGKSDEQINFERELADLPYIV